MAKKLYTAKEITRLVMDQRIQTLVLNKGDLITPMAHDTARDLGLKIVDSAMPGPVQSSVLSASAKPAPVQPVSDLESRVRAIVMAIVGQENTQSKQASPVIHVDGRSLAMPPFPFEINRPGMDVRLEDVITHQHGSPIAAGFMSLTKGNFPWTLTYDEIDYIIEGELHIGTSQGTVIGKPGDVLYIPKNNSITFGTPNWTKFFYITYPAEWSG